MNRRDALTALAALPLSVGMKQPEVVDAEPMPLFALVKCDRVLSQCQIQVLKQGWKDAFDGNPPFPLLVVHGNLEIEFHSRESILRQLEGK